MGKGKKKSLLDEIFGTSSKRKTTGGTSNKTGTKHTGIRNGGDTNKSPGVGYIVGGGEYYRPKRDKK